MPRGGTRPGAGRPKAEEPRDVTLAGVRLTRAKLEAYKEAAAKRGMTLTELVETTMDRECAKKIDMAD